MRRLLIGGLLALALGAAPGWAADIGTTLTIVEQLVSGVIESDDKQVHQAGMFALQIVSSVWEVVPGIPIAARVLESKDNGLTWTVLAGLTAETGPLPPPPRNVLPSVVVNHPNAKGSRRIKVELETGSPMLIGAVVTVDGTP